MRDYQIVFHLPDGTELRNRVPPQPSRDWAQKYARDALGSLMNAGGHDEGSAALFEAGLDGADDEALGVWDGRREGAEVQMDWTTAE